MKCRNVLFGMFLILFSRASFHKYINGTAIELFCLKEINKVKEVNNDTDEIRKWKKRERTKSVV